ELSVRLGRISCRNINQVLCAGYLSWSSVIQSNNKMQNLAAICTNQLVQKEQMEKINNIIDMYNNLVDVKHKIYSLDKIYTQKELLNNIDNKMYIDLCNRA